MSFEKYGAGTGSEKSYPWNDLLSVLLAIQIIPSLKAASLNCEIIRVSGLAKENNFTHVFLCSNIKITRFPYTESIRLMFLSVYSFSQRMQLYLINTRFSAV